MKESRIVGLLIRRIINSDYFFVLETLKHTLEFKYKQRELETYAFPNSF